MTPTRTFLRAIDALAGKPKLPKPRVAAAALLGPGVRGAKRAQLRCVADTGDVVLEHYRPMSGKPVNVMETQPPDAAEAAAAGFVPGDTVWGGIYKDHFGHMASEGVHRLWALVLRPELAGATVAFQVGGGPGSALNPWFAEMLALFGIAPAQMLFVNRVIRFERLHVPLQGRTLGGLDVIPGYPDIFPLVPPPALAVATRDYLYVSRLRHIHTGTYLGESLIEALLRDVGFDIVVPEETPIGVMLAKLRAAKIVVFAEGSAIHHLDLAGRIAARAFVIGRRPGTQYRFEQVLRSACSDWRILRTLSEPIGLDWNVKADELQFGKACSFVDLGDLVAALADFSGLDLPIPDRETASRAIALDLARYLMDPRTGATPDDAQLGRAFRKLREVVGEQDLFATAR